MSLFGELLYRFSALDYTPAELPDAGKVELIFRKEDGHCIGARTPDEPIKILTPRDRAASKLIIQCEFLHRELLAHRRKLNRLHSALNESQESFDRCLNELNSLKSALSTNFPEAQYPLE